MLHPEACDARGKLLQQLFKKETTVAVQDLKAGEIGPLGTEDFNRLAANTS